MKQRLYILLIAILTCVNAAWAKVQTVNGKTYNVIYMSSAGDGNKSGDDAANAVSGWANAYKKLSKTGGTYEDDWNKNIIVIVGSADISINITEANTNGIPATITNVWPWENEDGTNAVSGSQISNGRKLTIAGTARTSRIGAPTRFKNVCFTSGDKDCRMCLFLYHTMFDVGCIMRNMTTLQTTNGAMNTTTHKAPSFHLMLFSDENDFTQTTSPASAPWTQTEPMNLTIRSGKFGRILCTRIAGTTWSTQTSRRYTVGKPDQPLMAKIEVDIDPSTNTSDFNPTGYKDDIAFLCAGTTQGTVFVDMQMDIKRGQIATIVGGSQGNAIPVCSQNGIPTSTYCGRSTVNVIGENDSDVKIFRYFGGCLGRLTSNTSGTCSAFFYGHSTLNLVHGTIEQDVFASGGGLSGLRNPNNGDQHTSDKFIPYQGGSNVNYPFLGIDYSSYNASKNIVQITSVLKGASEVIDLADTKIITNMSGGVVKGNVYGGSYGYSSEMVVAAAPEGAGSLWGNTEVNISGGEIQGNVYGGGAGAKSYFNLATTDADRAKFLTVATVYGNTNLTITGKPTILGDIYGGGAGLASQAQNAKDTINVSGTETIKTGLTANEFLNIAKVYGNTNVTIDAAVDWEYTGSIYGGGALGAVEGNTNVIIKGGNITGNVFAGGLGEDGHTDKAKVTGSTLANIQGGTQGDEYAVYGGAQMALVDGNTVVILQGGTVGNAYGGGLGTNTMAANVTGDATVQLGSDGGTTASKVLGSIFGANNLNGTPEGHVLVHVLKTAPRDGQGTEEYDVAAVYGGGNLAAYEPTDANEFAEVLIENCDNSIEYVYGGGNAAPVPATQVTINGANAIDNAFAGGNGAGADNPGADIGYKGYFSSGAATEYGTGIATINVQGGTIHHVYGGSNTLGYIKDHAVVNVNAAGTCPMDVAELYGGGKMAPGKAAQINITCTGEGKIDNVYGGAHMADLTGDITLNINGGNIGNAFGGNNESGTINGAITVNVNWDTDACGTNSLNNVYGGGNKADYTGSPAVNILNGTVNENVFGGGLEATVTGNPEVNVTGGSAANIYGGGALADVSGNTSVVISGGTSGDVYGGGLGSAEVAASVGNTSVSVTGGTANNVFGCNNTNGSPTGTVNVEIAGGTVNNNVFGGGNLAAATVNPIVTVSGGTVTHDVYGGGALADVTGNTTVNLTGGAVGGAYGGALGSAEVAAKVKGDTYVHLDGSKVTETGIFGANNQNGTPTGHVKVHVTRTAPRDGFEYAVPAVYGGGNLSAYVPTNTEDFAEVLIENCDNSIEYVYGGGNAAPVPATKVTIYGANAINNAFAGGNGAGDGNPGADVGYKGYYSKGSREEYGSGTAYLTIYGGTVHKAYGGSNTLGYIRTKTTVELAERPADYEGTPCDLNVGEVHGGGNEAEMYCDGEVILGCTEGADKIFAGAKDADIHGNLTLNITSGTFGQVFGGNDSGGAIEGAIAVNVDETGCFPVIIGELYSCGNEAAYSVYGYNDDGTPIIDTTAEKKYDDPKINIIACTYIGKIFGGGNGKGARLYGSPTVNINPIKGTFAGKETTPLFVLKDGGVTREANSDPMSIPDDVGEIGTIYGGGNDADVYGDTHVNIGLKSMNHHVTGSDIETESEVSVNITGNVFGGGNKAVVTGNTNVTIGK